MHSGNTNEQTTLRPLEEKILNDFKLSKFIVYTDAGLSSTDNRKFNNIQDRAFITTQSVKKLKRLLKDWALDPSGWSCANSTSTYDIRLLDKDKDSYERYVQTTFYKECWIKEAGLEQKLIVTFSLKYRDYQRQIRRRQLERALNLIEGRPGDIQKKKTTDYKRLISSTNVTPDGEIAENVVYDINTEMIAKEAMFDNFG